MLVDDSDGEARTAGLALADAVLCTLVYCPKEAEGKEQLLYVATERNTQVS